MVSQQAKKQGVSLIVAAIKNEASPEIGKFSPTVRWFSLGEFSRMFEFFKQEEVKKWQEQDPIGIFHAFLTTNKKATVKTLDEIDERARQDVEKAVEFAEASPEPALDTLFDNIYAEEV